MRRLVVLVVAVVTVVAAAVLAFGAFAPDPRAVGTKVPAGAPLPLAIEEEPEPTSGLHVEGTERLAIEEEPGDAEPDLAAPPVALAPPGGAIVQQGVVRIPKPKIDLGGQRRVGIQIGHWQTGDVPKEYGARIQAQTGTSWAGYTEVDTTMAIAQRMATLLKAQGLAVDLLPTTIPEGYLADVFIALHCDGDGVGELSGFKMAHGTRRGPFEDKLMTTIKDVYANATGLSYDAEHVTRAMTGYYPFSWSRYLCGKPGMRIAGGTDEIQHNILAERVLGLPR